MQTAVENGTETADVDFETWVAARGDALLRFAYVLTGDAVLGEDAVQDALTTACAKWSRIRRADDPDAYVRRMIVNAHVSWWRRFRRREAPVAEPDLGAPVSPDGAGERAEADAVWALCATLPTQQRAAVVLRYYEGLSYAEIGEVLGCAEATARSRVYRALGTLKTALTNGGDDDD
ncbi:MAG TPA: SigE family RNA polymerase sigma factor [Kribbellaceae bacterium]|nr:SigE family RNA polymerase sigma factor [Kribbellaceae bacterium]